MLTREDNPMKVVPIDLHSQPSLRRPKNDGKSTLMKIGVLTLVVVATKYATKMVNMVADKLGQTNPRTRGIIKAAIGVGVWVGGDYLTKSQMVQRYNLPVQGGAAIIGGVIVAEAINDMGFATSMPAIAPVASLPAPAAAVPATTAGYYGRHGGYMNGGMLTASGSAAVISDNARSTTGRSPMRGAILAAK